MAAHHLVKGLTARMIIALIDIHQQNYGSVGELWDGRQLVWLENYGLVRVWRYKKPRGAQRFRAKLTKEGESRLSACLFKLGSARSAANTLFDEIEEAA